MASAPAAFSDRTSPPTILVVDDERAVREVVAAILEDEGYAVHCARDGIEALAVIAREQIDLVLSDVKMPRLDGIALARRLRSGRRGIPTVLMSAVYGQDVVPGCHLVRKPFDASELLCTIATLLLAQQRPPIPLAAALTT
ncbi:MAG: response regulator [Thermomicrobiales bacterium]|nr:response regulator [Thermomicrobiales bacterium]